MIISAIVATDKNGVIGKDGDIPWHLPADLKYFKRRTLNHHILMGRKSFESIGRPLPKRTNIVITHNPFYLASNCLVVPSLEEGLRLAEENGEEEAFVIGGGEIYRLAIPLVHRLYLTEVETEVEGGDTYFPDWDPEAWELRSSERREPDEDNEYAFTFKVFERKGAAAS